MTGPTSPTSDPARPGIRRGRRAGFTLIELSLTLAILGLVAALALPKVMPVRTATDLRVRAYQVAATMRADRNAADRTDRPVVTAVDVGARRVRSGTTGAVIALPDDVVFRFDGRPVGVVFSPDGRSSGGLLVVGRGKSGYGVRVDPVTSAVTMVEVKL